MPANTPKYEFLSWISKTLIEKEQTGLISAFASHFKVSRPFAAKTIKSFIEEGWIAVKGSVKRPTYMIGQNRLIHRDYQREDVDESIIWIQDFAPYFPLPANISDIAHYGFTEIANNAHDHSDGTCVQVVMALYNGMLYIIIEDNGIGIFRKIQQALNLPDPRLSLLELSKGKFTTDAANHSGEGIFFSSKLFDFFDIESNDLRFNHDTEIAYLIPAAYKQGTRVTMVISLDSPRIISTVFDEFALPDDNYSFEKTIVPVRLASISGENLISRSQAKRLVARFDGFRSVILDFSGVDVIGQAFADEVFRVFANAHPDVLLTPVNVSQDVDKMIRRAKAKG